MRRPKFIFPTILLFLILTVTFPAYIRAEIDSNQLQGEFGAFAGSKASENFNLTDTAKGFFVVQDSGENIISKTEKAPKSLIPSYLFLLPLIIIIILLLILVFRRGKTVKNPQ